MQSKHRHPGTLRTLNLAISVVLSACSGNGSAAPSDALPSDALPSDALPSDALPGDAPLPLSDATPDAGRNPDLPPDPATVAPALDRSVATTVFTATSFLYTGEHPIQTGVAPGTIELRRVAVLRGRVTGRDGSPVTGATVTILGHPEFGQTLTRADGGYDLATNGGGALVIDIRRPGFLQMQRTVDVPWQDYVPVPDITMLDIDPGVTTVELGGSAMQVARGPVINDQSGTRRATLLFRPGTQATVVTDTGTAALSTLSIHLTELTSGPNGPAAMPGSLPPTSAYTYAVEVTVDEAPDKSVELSLPALLYVENFLGFAPGTGMPVGAYDRDRGMWSAIPNGRVLKILSITSGAANLDSDGDGAIDSPATLAALGVTDQERQTLATLYAPGQVLWRSAVPHFSLIDCNRPFTLPPDAREPRLRDPGSPDGTDVDDRCMAGGSVIQCHNQSLGEDIPIGGTPYFLHYQSDRQAGRLTDYRIDIAVSDDQIPTSVTGITLDVAVAGQTFHRDFAATPNQHTVFSWDGKDAYGRKVQGRATAFISVGYVYETRYRDPPLNGNQFAQFPLGTIDLEASPVPGRITATIFQRWKILIGPFDALPLGLGGFTINVQHNYDVTGKVLHAGNGDTRSATTLGKTQLNLVAVMQQQSGGFGSLSLKPNGGYYVMDSQNNVVRDENSRIVAGVLGQANTFPCTYTGEGGPASQATLCRPTSLGSGPDGSLYVTGDGRIRRITPDGLIRTIAGVPRGGGPLFECAPSGVGGPATQAHLCNPLEVTAARDGASYFTDQINATAEQIFKIGVDGTLSVIAGTGIVGFSGDGGPAAQAALSTNLGIALDPDGNIVVADRNNFRIRRIATDGTIRTIAGTGDNADTGDGGPAIDASFTQTGRVAIGPDGTIYIAEPGSNTGTNSQRYRTISPQGIITAFAGDGRTPGSFDGDGQAPHEGLPPTDASFLDPAFIAVGADGAVYLSDNDQASFTRVVSSLPSYSVNNQVIASTDGEQLYVFDNSGRHQRTLDATTGAVLLKFAYDATGLLASITDVDGKMTTIERDAGERVGAIIGPFGQRSTLVLNDDGYLSNLTDPAGGKYGFTYGGGGLLATYSDPLNGLHQLTYDNLGRLTVDKDPGQRAKTLSRTGDANDSTVTMTTTLGRTTSYRIQRLPTGDQIWSNKLADGTTAQVHIAPDGSVTSTAPDGVTATQQLGPDPRFGMLAPIATSLTLHTPGGLVHTQTTTRSAQFSNAADPTTLSSMTETFTLNGKAFTRTYSAATKTVTITSPLGRQTTATLNDQGRIVSVGGPSETAFQVAYDASGRPTSVTHGARRSALTYGTDGRASTASDALGNAIHYDRDLLGRVIGVHGSDGGVAAYGFDALSNLASVTPPNLASHRFERNIEGQLTSYVAPDAGANTSTTSYDYNLDHELTAITAPDAASVAVAYDSAGRLARLALPEGPIDASYDASGRLATISAAGGVGLALGYDGSLPTDMTWTGPVQGTIHVAFDNDFRVQSESVNGEPSITTSYDDDGLVIAVGALTIVRDGPTGRLAQASVGSVVETYTPSELGELASATASCGGATLRTVSLTRDATGAITASNETLLGQPRTITYDHDAGGQLIAVHDGTSTATYVYDSNGNRTSAASPEANDTYDAQDRLVQHGRTTYTYTAAGHLRTKTDTTGTTTYAYDLLGNLRSAQLASGRVVTYVVDGMNRRIGKQVDGALVQGLLYDSDITIVAELDAGGAVVSRFVYGTRLNVPDYMLKGGATYRILSDHVGSPRLVVDIATCQVAERIDYDEFGRVVADSNPGFQPFGFAGGLYDRDTGLVRFGARDYDPEFGRWTAKDPANFEGGDTNLYVYAANDPIDLMDPTGLSFMQGLTNFSAGFGDKITFGGTRWIRKKLGVDEVVNPCSGWYATGGVAGVVVGSTIAGGLLAEAGAARNIAQFCFAAGTLVNTERGPVPIEDVQIGDRVWSRSDETGEQGYRRVVRTTVTPDRPTRELRFIDDRGAGETIEVTDEHPFWVGDRGWVAARDLRPGDDIEALRGGRVQLASTNPSGRTTTVYNFEVEEFHTYFVGIDSLWVHNTCEAITRPLLASDLGLSRASLETLEGVVTEAGSTRILQVENIVGRIPPGELRGALQSIVNQATADGVETLQIAGRFANERLQTMVALQAEQLGGTVSSAGGLDVLSFILGK